jgi:putative component of membrane protein insertase Oxa1/YidC/SpoIIIJ protein YidD
MLNSSVDHRRRGAHSIVADAARICRCSAFAVGGGHVLCGGFADCGDRGAEVAFASAAARCEVWPNGGSGPVPSLAKAQLSKLDRSCL